MIGKCCCNPRQKRSLRLKTTGATHTARLNRRLQETADLEMFRTMIVVGPTPDQIYVLIPDSVGPTVDADSPADLQHVVGLSLGSAENLSSTLPPEGLHLALCLHLHSTSSLRPTLGLGRQDYWSEVTLILRNWQSVNDASCPHCCRVIRVSGGVRSPAAQCGFLQN